ncbi:MAG: hypothetical protein ACP5QU_01900, partial [Anaerolineae bacterium]
MPLKKPAIPPRKSNRTAGKAAPAKGSVRPTRKPPEPPPPAPSLWARLSPERRLDVLGVAMALIGLLTLLSLISAQR